MATSQNQRMLSAVACEIGWIPTESRTTLFRAPPAGASNPVIQGEVSGVEVRAQFLPYEAAVFTGTCDCIVDDRNAPGFFWVLCRMIHFQMLVSLQRSIAANGISLHYGPAFLVRSSVVKSSTRAIIRSKSPLGFVFKKVAGIVTVLGLLDDKDFPPTFDGDLFSHRSLACHLFCSSPVNTSCSG